MGLVYWNRVGRKMGVELGLINRFGFLFLVFLPFYFFPYKKEAERNSASFFLQKEHKRT